ncbi:UNVERIFIED_CONTAM: hypothetical protein GTU68_028458 [Idotea baltica]|nr:hypothetical protein [Idotea baltica]
MSNVNYIYANKPTIYPPKPDLFQAFELCPFDELKVVIIGQDPYHRAGQAMGLSFSVPPTIKIPPSLRNVFKELKQDLNIDPPVHGDLTDWARQGVFLLNSILTVEEGRPGSHRKLGWQTFTDATIQSISMHKNQVVFLLWGNHARSKKEFIDADKHLILEAAHPSPLARNKFMNNRHFSQTNNYLIDNDLSPINWQLT